MARPYFIWNADLSDADVRAILVGARGELEQAQMIAHIMQHARFEDVWKYVAVVDIVQDLAVDTANALAARVA
jgi:hypothetical protein